MGWAGWQEGRPVRRMGRVREASSFRAVEGGSEGQAIARDWKTFEKLLVQEWVLVWGGVSGDGYSLKLNLCSVRARDCSLP